MQKALHIRTTVLPGGKIEIVGQELPVGGRCGCCSEFRLST